VVEPWAEARDKLQAQFGITAQPQAGPALARAHHGGLGRQAPDLQGSGRAGARTRQHALHLSVAAGIRSDSIAQWLGSERIVRPCPTRPRWWARA
jgi:pyrroline-5-carboxylate reductase